MLDGTNDEPKRYPRLSESVGNQEVKGKGPIDNPTFIEREEEVGELGGMVDNVLEEVGGEQRPSTPDLNSSPNSEDSPSDDSPSIVRKDIARLLTHTERLLLQRLEKIIHDATEDTLKSPLILVGLIKTLQELRLSHEWTERLVKAIESNPKFLKVPGSKGSRLLEAVIARANSLKNASSKDRRAGATKRTEEDLPLD